MSSSDSPWVLILKDDAKRCDDFAALVHGITREYALLLDRDSRKPEDVRRLKELLLMLLDQVGLIDNQCDRWIKQLEK